MKFIAKEDTNKASAVISTWSFAHFLSGLGWFFFASMFTNNVLLSFILYFILHTIYEVKDYVLYKNSDAEIKRNTPENTLGDTLIGILGFMTGFYLLAYGVVKNNPYSKLITIYIILILYGLFLIYEIDTVTAALS